MQLNYLNARMRLTKSEIGALLKDNFNSKTCPYNEVILCTIIPTYIYIYFLLCKKVLDVLLCGNLIA